MIMAVLVLMVLVIASILVISLLKSNKGSFAQGGTVYVNPCPQGGAWVAVGPQCQYVFCAPVTNGQLNAGFYESEQECLNSIPGEQSYYPVTGT